MKPPLSLYIHIPWCIRKCPYCDFNSHQVRGELDETHYIDTLLKDFDQHLPEIENRKLHSVFIGGGTPSLFKPESFARLFDGLAQRVSFENPNSEITLEANPGTFEQARFQGYREAGINRLSIGVQSFQNDKLKRLGRIHEGDEARRAIDGAINAGFQHLNIDLMHGLPEQSIDDALFDLNTACAFGTDHLSWYQLTLEPNTVFAKFPPTLPDDDHLWAIQTEGLALLNSEGFERYEISAYTRGNNPSQHNLNYWEFGDYIGIGAGAHGKLTTEAGIFRHQKKRSPKDYLADQTAINVTQIDESERPVEFMMNALRLSDGVLLSTFTERTGLALDALEPALSHAQNQGWLIIKDGKLRCTELGQRFLNECLVGFMA
ncbi:MAG: YggW family oxidoreductase [Gammaproteobacteria bacterium CG11_big_fil_rev_8_21_14_0_20_46_22]|nr:MAG: YggW family oxidoreductase [Gammaproteobacteria bacterium CG12_big_fil_rev_8_21_14_0_65_46_12]PIR10285.1 MAG: YggW family oxidoreductase [Gammaproteobacteria bacterium CG11_big_fil_rev_8_21_14_0_20_46_22]